MSPHWTICSKLETHLTAWAGTAWDAAHVHADFLLENLKQLIGDDHPTVIGILPMTVEDMPDREARRHDEDLIGIGVLILSRLPDLDRDDLIAIDGHVHDLRQRLRAIYRIDIDGVDAERERVSLPTTYDSDLLSKSEFWASLITCEYAYDSGEVSEVSV